MEGFIYLHRQIFDWGWYKNANTFRVFVHLLLSSNHKEKFYMGKLIKRGQVIVGRNELAISLNITEQMVRTAINHLKSTNEITIKSTNKFSIVTIVKYELYQNKQNKITNKITNNQPTENTTFDENIENLNQQNNQQNNQQENSQNSNIISVSNNFLENSTNISTNKSTNHQPTNNQQSTTNNNDNNDNNDNKIKYRNNIFLKKNENEKLISEYGEVFTNSCYDYLSSYKLEKNYKTKSDYLTIRRWVVEAVEKKIGNNKNNQKIQFSSKKEELTTKKEYWQIAYGHLAKTKEEFMQLVAKGVIED